MSDQPIGVTKWEGGAHTFVDPSAERNECVTLHPNGYCSAPANSPHAVGIAYFGPRLLDHLVAARLAHRGQFAACARCYRPVERCDCHAPRPAGHTCGKTCDCG